MKKILFRCDSSSVLGTGHVTRSFALAEVFALNGWEVTFSGVFEAPKWIFELLNKIKNVIIENPTKIIQQDKDYEVIVFDSYNFDSGEISTLRKSGTLIVYVIDDISPIMNADVYVSTLTREYLPQFIDRGKFLFGVEYALIRKEIIINKLRNIRTLDVFNQRKTLGLFSGGSAKKEFLEIMLNQLIPELNGWNIKIFSEHMDLKNYISHDVKLEIISPKPDFYCELNDINLVVSSASVSSWEFLSMDIPLAVYGIYQNQKSAYEFIVGGGYAEGLGFVENYNDFVLNKVNLRKAVDKISNSKVSQFQNRKLVDGNGPTRVYDEIIKLI
jgi:spore coat polysaccharide biosynthesis predicted glycosyltransferase SpsG